MRASGLTDSLVGVNSVSYGVERFGILVQTN